MLGIVSSQINRQTREWCLKEGSVEIDYCRSYYIENPYDNLISNGIIIFGILVTIIFFRKTIQQRIKDILILYKQDFKKNKKETTKLKSNLIKFSFSFISFIVSVFAIDQSDIFILVFFISFIALIYFFIKSIISFKKVFLSK